jgi:hypothetical protein
MGGEVLDRSTATGARERPRPAALSGSLLKAPGFAGGYLLERRDGCSGQDRTRAAGAPFLRLFATSRRLARDAKQGTDPGDDPVEDSQD